MIIPVSIVRIAIRTVLALLLEVEAMYSFKVLSYVVGSTCVLGLMQPFFQVNSWKQRPHLCLALMITLN